MAVKPSDVSEEPVVTEEPDLLQETDMDVAIAPRRRTVAPAVKSLERVGQARR
jgi:hypothetical protein